MGGSIEFQLSLDEEADDSIPGSHSMSSFGSAAYLENKTSLPISHASSDKLPLRSDHYLILEQNDQPLHDSGLCVSSGHGHKAGDCYG